MILPLHHSVIRHASEMAARTFGAAGVRPEIANRGVTRAGRLNEIKADILKNLDNELTVTAIALRQGVTPRYIQMLFKKEGVTFSEFVLRQRLLRARDMLRDGHFASLNITSVALASGFNDLSYFNRTFRRRFGTTPSALRKTVYQDELSSGSATCRGKGYVNVPVHDRFRLLTARKRTQTDSQSSPFGKSLSVLTSICEVMKRAALGQEISSNYFEECLRTVSRDFWTKCKWLVEQVPCVFLGQAQFVKDLVPAYYCAMDKTSPVRARGLLLASLAYFIVPFDLIPDATPVLGLADDTALLAMVIGRVSSHITPVHLAAAARTLEMSRLFRTHGLAERRSA